MELFVSPGNSGMGWKGSILEETELNADFGITLFGNAVRVTLPSASTAVERGS